MLKRMIVVGLMFLCALAFTGPVQAEEGLNTHEVKQGDTLYKIGMKYGVSVQQIQAMNDMYGTMIYPGQELILPVTLEEWEEDLLARLVEAEAKGESYAGKVAVATVVLNRVESPLFPDSLYGVIYQSRQFEPVDNGHINDPASHTSRQAVEEALSFQGFDGGSLFFYNPDKVSSAYHNDREVTVVIGNHVFSK
ncbi:cell wall hydrolase [Halobacillus yeomjeoni]|uniref:cell wall hydrolase n=1 Tax=Halobacillus yeomjeoni TaxID=311194 RepID=UPI002E1C3A96|nr:cell wall hydrolase [Halobacillus yeomjeoni]